MINILNISLFITNIWIILYTRAIDYLYFLFPPIVNESFYGSRLPNPEPFEISLYIILSVFFVCLIWFGTRSRIDIHMPFSKIIFLFLLILFVFRLGAFPLSGDLHPYPVLTDKTVYILIFMIFQAVVVFLTFQMSQVQKLLTQKSISPAIFYSLIFLLIVLFVADFSFPISPLDIAHFYGPIYEVTSGKTLFTNIPSQYGFLSILLFSAVYKITHINFVYLLIFIELLFALQYFICFYLIFKISRSLVYSFLGLSSILTVHYFAATYGPQAGPLRWFPVFLLIFLFYKFKKIDSRRLLFLTPVLALWNLDSGLALLSGYLFSLFIFTLSHKISFKRFAFSLIFLFLSAGFIILLIQAFHLFAGLPAVNFLKFYHSISKNAVIGILMVPMENTTYFWLFMLLYFASVIYFFKVIKAHIPVSNALSGADPAAAGEHAHWLEKHGIEPDIILFSANLMLFASIYYIGRSMPNELYTISAFFLLTLFLFAGLYYRDIKSNKLKIAVNLFLFFFLIFIPGWQRKEFISAKIMGRYGYYEITDARISAFQLDNILKKTYAKEISLINNNIKQKEAIILSADDTYLFYLTRKKNLLDANPVVASIEIGREMGPAIEKAIKSCPAVIAADCSIINKCQPYKSLSTNRPEVLSSVLRKIEVQCNHHYESTICTDKLCILKNKIK